VHWSQNYNEPLFRHKVAQFINCDFALLTLLQELMSIIQCEAQYRPADDQQPICGRDARSCKTDLRSPNLSPKIDI
jgi:hypothetical protein